ncbi:MAG: hypothetical protein RLZZ312_777 [Bacteroidota bacterium]|jgi:hypothetical protein
MAIVLLLVVFVNNILVCLLHIQENKELAWRKNIEKSRQTDYQTISFNASVYTFVDDTEVEIVNQNIEINNRIYFVFTKQIINNRLVLKYLPNNNLSQTVAKFSNIIERDAAFSSNPLKKDLGKIFKIFDKDFANPIEFKNNFSFDHDAITACICNELAHNTCCGYLLKETAPPENSLA